MFSSMPGRMSRPVDNQHQQVELRRDLREDTADLHARIDRLTLVTEALWTLLQEASNLTEEHLKARMRELDESDGQADGTHRPAAARCTKCEAAIGHGRRTCMFCGAEAEGQSAFRSV